ncbi:hypothetical protein H0H81_012673 [Sphagnurus paluster]|uniref:Uncharacterized protein n=1 Tax=Sphagnurus paluster TaxID=117069 RepID=A0A9P7KFH7_9AGAR|nr:hypothetical protein H0H81_012673 [Sphagnurus paluster]
MPTRLSKAILPSLSIILARPSEIPATEQSEVTSSKSKKGKKRAIGYEGDEVFKISREVICPNTDDTKVMLVSLKVMQSISSRVLLSMLLSLPQIPPAALSPDLQFHRELLQLVQSINTELGSGTASVMSKSLGLVVRATLLEHNGINIQETFRDLEILLHPRVPPLVRSLPHVESLSLFRAEEPQEEIDIRKKLGLCGAFPDQSVITEDARDVIMEDDSRSPHPQNNSTNPLASNGPVEPPEPIPTLSKDRPAPLVSIPRPHIEPPRAKPAASPANITKALLPTIGPQEEDDDDEMPVINMDSDSDDN